MKKVSIAILIGILILVMSLWGLKAGLSYLFLGRITAPSTKDFVAIAQKNQYIVQAVYDFKADHGVWPQKLDDLVPAYLTTVPKKPWTILSNDTLMIPAGAPHTGVCYSFREGQEGWSANGDFGVGPLPLPKGASTRPALTGDAMVKARLAEYDRRIASVTGDQSDTLYFARTAYVQKIVYLITLNRKAEALKTCKAAADAYPDWWRPRMAALIITPQEESAKAEAEFRAWVDQHPTFIHYCYIYRYCRDKNRLEDAITALRQAVKHSLADDDDAVLVPDAYAFDAAAFACNQRQPELVLQITNLWEKPRGVYTYHNDNLHAFRAAAELALGRFAEAQADLDRVVAASKTQGLWVGNLDQLGRAVTAKDQSFMSYNRKSWMVGV